MINLITQLEEYIKDPIQRGYRNKRGFYATHIGGCPRKVYNQMTDAEESNSADLISHLNFWVGDGFESALMKSGFSKLYMQGIHVLNYQCSVGSDDPKVNGYADFLLGVEQQDKTIKPMVVELKTKYGYGTKKMLKERVPNEEHVYQLGYYLKDLNDKGVTNEGCLFYMIMQDYYPTKSIVQFNCVYNEDDKTVTVYEVHSSAFESEGLNIVVNLEEELEVLRQVQKDIDNGVKSKCKYQHKLPVTISMLRDQTDNAIKEALVGNKLLGDWQCSFCSYKELCAKEEGRELFYNEEELKLINEEHENRKALKKAKRKTTTLKRRK